MTLVDEAWSPPTSAISGRFGMWRKSEALSYAGGAVAGIGDVAQKSPTTTALIILGVADKPRAVVGAWFRLTREPSPRKSLGGILAEIDRATSQSPGWALAECRRLVAADSGGKRPVVLALGYPDRALAGQEAWLFLEAHPESATKPIRWREQPTLDRASVRASETVAINSDALMRRIGPLAKAVANRTVLVFGIGAVGSSIALLLARSGIERLILVDSDRMRPGNAVRHVLSLTDIGKKKGEAMWWDILVHVPDVKVEYLDATWQPANLDARVSRADVVVDATADQPFNLLLNEICVRAKRQLVQVETLRRAAIGRVRVVRPGRDACLLCYTEHVKTTRYPVVPPGDDGEFFDAGCGVPTVEAPAVDVEATANWAARVVLWMLQDTLGPRNHLLVVNEEIPGLSGELSTVGIHWGVYAALPGCECCDRRNEVSTDASVTASHE
ncbi:MAG: HesA/MoeB/ThiF family protein [Gemmatimonadaceae bacterium]